MKKIKVFELKPGDIFKGSDEVERVVLFVPDFENRKHKIFIDLKNGHLYHYLGNEFEEDVTLLREGAYHE